MGNVQVEVAIAVEIGPGGTATPQLSFNSRAGSFLRSAVALIAEQLRSAVAGDQQIRKPSLS